MKNQAIPLSLQLDVERLKRFLANNPDQAPELAVNYFEDFSMLAIKYNKLKSLTPKSHKDVCLPPIPNRRTQQN